MIEPLPAVAIDADHPRPTRAGDATVTASSASAAADGASIDDEAAVRQDDPGPAATTEAVWAQRHLGAAAAGAAADRAVVGDRTAARQDDRGSAAATVAATAAEAEPGSVTNNGTVATPIYRDHDHRRSRPLTGAGRPYICRRVDRRPWRP
jgi:hypothetical protein